MDAMKDLDWASLLILAGLAAAAYLVVVWIGLIWWTYRDVMRRTSDPNEQWVAVLLVTFFAVAGWLVYLLMRPQGTLDDDNIERLQQELLSRELASATACTRCRRRVSEEFLTCPYCREELRMPCAICARPIVATWVACAYCGADASPQPTTARPVRPAAAPVPARTPAGSPRPGTAMAR